MRKGEAELERLRTRLAEAEETLEAIRSGEVDALVVGSADGDQIYTLRGADHPYRLLLQEMNEGAATLMSDGTVLYCNKCFAALLGVSLEKVIGLSLGDFVAPSSAGALHAILRSAQHVRIKEELAFRTPKGEVPAYCCIGPVELDGVECLSLVATDLTEQKRSEEVVASGKLARQILERAVDVIVVCDENGRITHASREAHALAGTTSVLHRDFAEVFPLNEKHGQELNCTIPGDGSGLDGSLVKGCLGGRTVHGVEVELRRDGKKLDLLMSSGPLRGGNDQARGCVFTLTDITRLKATEAQLKQSQADLSAELADTQLLQRISAELIHEENAEVLYNKLLDAAVKITRSDFASMQMLYPERGELRLLAFRGFTPEAARFWEWVRPASECSCGAALRTRRRIIVRDVDQCDFMLGSEDLVTYHQTGIQAVQTTPLVSRGGKVVGMISTHWSKPHEPSERDLRMLDILARQAADLIERRRAEEELRESREQLRRQAEELEQQLIASGRLVSLGEITASMAHEFNNPLGIVMGFAEDLLSDKKPEDSDYQALKIMHDETKRCQKIIQDLLEYSRPKSVEKRIADVGEIVEKSLQLMANHIYKNKIATQLEMEPNLPPIEADPRQIEQVLVNLYLNAIDAMPDGGRLHVSLGRAGADTLEIAVSDTGIGISREELEKIFQPFFSAKKKSGLGLGLPISRRIVANHGGRIAVESRPAQGATFRIFLPVSEAGSDEIAERAVG
jgi:PAS domain S-box-containing protein